MNAIIERSAAKRLLMKKTKICRMIAVLLLVLPLIFIIATPTYAIEETQPEYDWTTLSDTPLREMFAEINFWYRVVRNYLVVPCMAVAFAACGYQVMFAALQNKPWAIDAAIKNVVTVATGTFLIFALPSILTLATNIFRPLAWKP